MTHDPFAPAVIVEGFVSDTTHRLAHLAGVSFERLPSLIECVDLMGGPSTADPSPPWQREVAMTSAGDLARRYQGRRLLMMGALVARAFGAALGHGRLPLLAELRTSGLTLVRLPAPGDMSKSPEACAVLRAEVERRAVALSSWCAIDGSLVYCPVRGAIGTLASGSREPDFDTAPTERRAETTCLLCWAASRVPRWGASADCWVMPHSIDVAARAAQLAKAAGERLTIVTLCVIEAAAHDLHECLPLHGDVPGPVCRLLRLTSPAWAMLEDRARAAVRRELALPDIDPVIRARVDAIVHQADLDCRSAERAFVFGDAPAWLGSRGQALARYGLTLGQADRLAAAQVYTRDDAHRGVSILINALDGICPEFGINAPCTLLPVIA